MNIIHKTNTTKLFVISGVMIFLTIGFFLILLASQKTLRKECPLKWVQMQSGEKEEYFVYDDDTLTRDEVDLDWILSNCEISKDLVY